MTQSNTHEGGVLPKSKRPSASARVAESLKVKTAIEKSKREESPIPMLIDTASTSASSATGSPDDTQMMLLRTSLRQKVKPQMFVPGSTGPKKTRGPLTEEQKAARSAARAVTLAAKVAQPVVPTQEQLEAVRKEQAIVARANEIIAEQMQLDAKRPSRKAKSEQEAKSRWNNAYEQAKKELAKEKKEEKKAMVSEIDALADLIGQMTTSRPVVAPVPVGQAMHSSGHAIVGYDPRDGWPLGVNPATGQIERFATKDGGKKKRSYKKKSQKGGEGEVEGAVAENEKSLPAPVDQAGGKKKRSYKKKSQKGGEGEVEGEVEGAGAENEKSLPAPVDQAGGKKKRSYKKKSQKGGEGEVEGAVAENEKSLPAPVDQAGGKKKRKGKK